MAQLSKHVCILKYQEYKGIHGTVPKFREFLKFAGLHERHIVALYGRDAYAKLQQDCGDTPNKLTLVRISRDAVMRQYGDLALELGELPRTADWSQRALKPGTSGLSKSPHFIKWRDFPRLFAEWVDAERVWGMSE